VNAFFIFHVSHSKLNVIDFMNWSFLGTYSLTWCMYVIYDEWMYAYGCTSGMDGKNL
jgi:hypothetical protein